MDKRFLTTDYLLADKPDGVATHSPGDGREGFVEYLARQTGEQLRVCHRLDRETSGAIVFARSSRAAQALAQRFAKHQVFKRYWLVTDRHPPLDDQVEIATHIHRRKGGFVSSSPSAEGNARSQFRRLEKKGRFALWQVEPSTGKPHQIRLHARQLGLPVLGDSLYGGTSFPRLMLHAQAIGFADSSGEEIFHQVPAPAFFTQLDGLADQDLIAWLAALDRRRRLFDLTEETTLRLVHNEGRGLRCDKLGPVCYFYWYRPQAPSESDLERVAQLAAAAGTGDWLLQHMLDRGADPQRKVLYGADQLERWQGREGDLQYIFKLQQGASPGLFLDQRQNRAWLHRRAAGQKVLNLFAYTGGFGLCAVAGGAAQVVNVDVSRRALDWARENFALNDLAGPEVEFWASEAQSFLRGCHRRGRRFDLIVCDPPSFARNKRGVFRVERDLPDLVRQCMDALEEGGRLLVSTNSQRWSQTAFRAAVESALPTSTAIEPMPPADWDFEWPGEEPVLKALCARKE